ncbi:MAG: hypothetical protein KKB20_17270 [Proteobacteria bacterium]|nr:hypothetical protein [Pseudomonadota bacterium]
MAVVLKNIPISDVEKEFSKALHNLTGYYFTVSVKDIDYETGETVLEVHVVDLGEKSPELIE